MVRPDSGNLCNKLVRVALSEFAVLITNLRLSKVAVQLTVRFSLV